jgi:antirestriction protein ArdC
LGELKKGQDWRQEVVAELTAAVLCQIVGKTSRHLGNHYRYIESYGKEASLTAWQACVKVMSDVEKVLNLILRRDQVINGTQIVTERLPGIIAEF